MLRLLWTLVCICCSISFENFPFFGSDIVKDYTANKSRITADRLRTTHFYQLSDSSNKRLLISSTYKITISIGTKNAFRARQIDMDTGLLTCYTAVPLDPFNGKIPKQIEFSDKVEVFPPSVKVSARAYSESEIIVRLANLDDSKSVDVKLVEKDGSIPILSYLSGMKSVIKDAKVEEVSLNTIMTKREVLQRKFELHELGKIDIESLLVKGTAFFLEDPFIIIRLLKLPDEALGIDDIQNKPI